MSNAGSFRGTPTTYDADSGSADPSSGVLNILGGTDISTVGSGNTITINNDQDRQLQKQVFTSSGTFTYPAGTSTSTVFKVTVTGGGGGGGSNYNSGSGGGSGATAIAWVTGKTPSTTETVTVGAGGAAVSTGGASSFGSLAVAGGGLPGSNSNFGIPGLGGAATAGDILVHGGSGCYGFTIGGTSRPGTGGPGYYGGYNTQLVAVTAAYGSGGAAYTTGFVGAPGIVVVEWSA